MGLRSGERTGYDIPAVLRITRFYNIPTVLWVSGFSQATAHVLKVFVGQLDIVVGFTKSALAVGHVMSFQGCRLMGMTSGSILAPRLTRSDTGSWPLRSVRKLTTDPVTVRSGTLGWAG